MIYMVVPPDIPRYKLSFLFGKSVNTTQMPVRTTNFKNSTSAKLGRPVGYS